MRPPSLNQTQRFLKLVETSARLNSWVMSGVTRKAVMVVLKYRVHAARLSSLDSALTLASKAHIPVPINLIALTEAESYSNMHSLFLYSTYALASFVLSARGSSHSYSGSVSFGVCASATPGPNFCERSCGAGWVPCGDNCYNPNQGQDCCNDGSK